MEMRTLRCWVIKKTHFVRRFAPPRDSDSLLLFDYYKRIKKKMSVGKSLVSKCHQARFPFGRDLPSFRCPSLLFEWMDGMKRKKSGGAEFKR